jgi:hypothetical protein
MNNNISMSGVGGTMAIGEAYQAIQRGHSGRRPPAATTRP